MTPDGRILPVRSFPYRTGWRIIGCSALFFSLLGAIGCMLVPFGWGKLQNGQLPLGVAYMTIGLFGLPMVVMAIGSLVTGVRHAMNPPRVEVTESALLLPRNLRDESTPRELDDGAPSRQPAQPEVIPFAAIRSVRREGPRNAGSDRLIISHALAPAELVVHQFMMDPADFDELEKVLRNAIPPAVEAHERAGSDAAI